MFSIILTIYVSLTIFAHADDAIIIDSSGNVKNVDEKPVEGKERKAKINVDFQKADIHSVMRFFAHVGNTNIVLDDQVQGRVTVRLEGVYWEEAFTAVLWSQGLMAVPQASMYMVSPIQNSKP